MRSAALRISPALLLAALLLPLVGTTQPGLSYPKPPEREAFVPLQAYLSAGWMEGREAGTKGDSLAAGFIAAVMQTAGLTPFGTAGGWFQSFTVVKYLPERYSLALTSGTEGVKILAEWIPGTDVLMDTVPFEGTVEAVPVFAGYGLSSPASGYDDYRNVEAGRRIVVLMNGYPGHRDTTSPAGKAHARTFGGENGELSKRIETARKKGAVAVVLLNGLPATSPGNGIDAPLQPDAGYTDHGYYLPGKNLRESSVPCFRLSPQASALLLSALKVDPDQFERDATRGKSFRPAKTESLRIHFSATLRQQPVEVRNILGMIPGKDTGRFVLIGAHYDHLGMRNNRIYYGADDNASGVAGMLALAGRWARFPEKPPCNLLFAAWTAEEKGVLGSEYFAENSSLVPERISLVINLDMISRSAMDDTARKVLSIGTRTADETLRTLARENNARLAAPFTLDLWDVTGHCGSDYCHFASRNIPVMTFFSGFQEDYHTPLDRFERTDPDKTEKILRVVNDCLGEGALQIRKP